MAIRLGDRVRDRVTGLTGIALCRTEWLNKCVRVCIQPQEVKDGKPADGYTVDEEQLEIVESGAVAINKPQTGGPMNDKAAQRR